jgi:hypothetical protein
MQVEMTQAQPAQSQPMRYVSPRQTSEPGASEENQARSAWEDREHAAQSASIEKTRGKNAIRANYNHHKRQDNRPSPKAKSDDPDRNNKTAGKTAKIDADDAHFDRGGAKNQKRSGNDEISGHNNPAGESSKLGGLEACSYSMVDKKPIPQASGQKSKPTHGVSHKVDKKLLDKDKASTNDKDDGSQVISLTHELSECPRQEIITKYTNDTDNVSQQHTLVECSTIEIEDHVLVPQAKPHLLTDCSTIEVDSGDNCSQHTLVECTTVEIEDRTVGTTISVNAKENTPAQHTLTGCETATIASTSTMEPQEKTHLLADCVTIKVDAKKNTGSQNTLSSSDTVVTSTSILEQYALSECETTMHEAQELSYVHDFTDCPVDKSILEYYEEEEKRAREEQSGSARRLHTSNSSFQYALANCPTGHATTSSTARQNRRASHTHISGESHKIRQHRLSSCPVSGTEGYQKTKAAHHVAETHRVVASDDSQATQMLLGSREGKSRAVDERTRSERCLGGSQHPSYTQYGQLEKSSSKEIKSSGSRSGEQHNHSKNKNKADNVAGTSHPKHKKHLKGSVANEAKALNTKSSGSKSPRPAAQSAQHALAQVLASNGGTKESSQKGGAVQSQMGDGSEVRKTKIGDGAPSTGDGHTRQQLEKIGAQEQKGQSGGISGIFSKMTLKTKGQC